ncbi:MAG: ABC transporter substrate-binding protein, partial [Desulfovermiculus sp.]
EGLISSMKHLYAGLLFFLGLFVLGHFHAATARTVTDELDRKVQLPKRIERIVSLAPSITESVFAIDQGHRLVGVTQYSNHPPQAKDLPAVGSYINLNVEKIVALQPDLCLATKDGNPYQAISQLERAGIPVYALDPRDLPAIMETILDLGRVLDAEEKARQVAGAMQQEVREIKEVVGQAESRPRVFYQIGVSPIVSAGKDTFAHELITLAGGENVAAHANQYPRYSREDVLVFNPDVILINTMGKEEIMVQEEKEKWQKFDQIRAVKNGRIHALDPDLFNRPTPKLTRALAILVQLFHPQLAGKLNVNTNGVDRAAHANE